MNYGVARAAAFFSSFNFSLVYFCRLVHYFIDEFIGDQMIAFFTELE